MRRDIEDFWTWVIILVVLAIAGLLYGGVLRINPAHGHAGDDALSSWYRSLQMPSGASCCNLTDCFPVDARIEGDHWEAKIDDEWRAVPQEVVLKRENMEGRAVACVYRGELRCFVPPNGVQMYPDSPDANKLGCSCPALSTNNKGEGNLVEGVRGWIVNPTCKIHSDPRWWCRKPRLPKSPETT